MIPMGRLSTIPQPSAFLPPDNVAPSRPTIDREFGGIGLNDPSEGLMVQIWLSWYNVKTGNVMMRASNYSDTPLFRAPGITELSFTFDQNMRPFHTFVQSGQAKFRWFDTNLNRTVITDLDPNDMSPRCALDDKRQMQVSLGTNDIILAYMRGGDLYYRQQRDRYTKEYLLATGVNRPLERIGMSRTNRLQFLFGAPYA